MILRVTQRPVVRWQPASGGVPADRIRLIRRGAGRHRQGCAQQYQAGEAGITDAIVVNNSTGMREAARLGLGASLIALFDVLPELVREVAAHSSPASASEKSRILAELTHAIESFIVRKYGCGILGHGRGTLRRGPPSRQGSCLMPPSRPSNQTLMIWHDIASSCFGCHRSPWSTMFSPLTWMHRNKTHDK